MGELRSQNWDRYGTDKTSVDSHVNRNVTGFGLVEILISVVILGLSVAAVLQFIQATSKNNAGSMLGAVTSGQQQNDAFETIYRELNDLGNVGVISALDGYLGGTPGDETLQIRFNEGSGSLSIDTSTTPHTLNIYNSDSELDDVGLYIHVVDQPVEGKTLCQVGARVSGDTWAYDCACDSSFSVAPVVLDSYDGSDSDGKVSTLPLMMIDGRVCEVGSATGTSLTFLDTDENCPGILDSSDAASWQHRGFFSLPRYLIFSDTDGDLVADEDGFAEAIFDVFSAPRDRLNWKYPENDCS